MNTLRAEASPVDSRILLNFPQLVSLLGVVLAVLVSVFGIWTATSVWSFPHFLVAVFILIYLPGRLLVDVFRLRVRILEHLCISLTLGMMVSGLFYWIFMFLGVPQLFFVLPVAVIAFLCFKTRIEWKQIRGFRIALELYHVLLFGLIILSLALLVVVPMYYRNLSLSPQGGMTFLVSPPDVIMQMTIAQELTHTIPPQIPFIAGHSLNYHYAMPLVTAMLSRNAKLSVLDLTARFMPTFFLVLTMLSVFCFGRVWLRSGYAATFATLLVVFGEDFSFVPGLLQGSGLTWSAQYFRVPSTFSLYFSNPMLPALGVLFSGLFCLGKFLVERSRSWLILTAFMFALLVEFKVFTALHVFLALAIAGIVFWLLLNDFLLMKVSMLTGFLAFPLVLFTWLINQGGSKQWVRIDYRDFIPNALAQLHLLPTTIGCQANAMLTGGSVALVGVLALFLVVLPGYLIGSLGIRVVAIPEVFRSLFLPASDSGLKFLLALFVVIGPLVTLTTKITPMDYPDTYNNMVWFYAQSKYVLWIFAVDAVWQVLRTRRRVWYGIIPTVMLGLSLPSTVQYFHRRASEDLDVLNRDELSLVEYLNTDPSCEGEVVLSPPREAVFIAALTKCRVPFIDLYAFSFVSRSEADRLRNNLQEFWSAWNRGEIRGGLLENLKVSLVVAERKPLETVSESRGGFNDSDGSDDKAESLQMCFQNDGFVVYRVVRSACRVRTFLMIPAIS